MYKLFLTVRYLYSRRIAYFAMAAVTLCVAMVLIVMSVMGGWLDQVMLRAKGLLGDVIVDNQSYGGFPLYEEFISEISAWPEIEQATPVLYTFGLIRFAETEQTGTVRVVGMRLEDVYRVNAFKSGLFYEKFYPGTTTLDEQRQPLLGADVLGPPLHIRPEDNARLLRPLLPEPYASALERARRAHQQATGTPLRDDDSAPSHMDTLLREHGAEPIPGVFELAHQPLPPPEDATDQEIMAWVEGHRPRLAGDPLPGIIIGRDILCIRQSDGTYQRLYAKGLRVSLTLWATSVGGNVDPVPIKQHFRYADDSRTGIYEIDSQHVYVGFDLLQQILQMDEAQRVDPNGQVIGKVPARCSQIQINVRDDIDNDPVALAALCERLERRYHAYLGETPADEALMASMRPEADPAPPAADPAPPAAERAPPAASAAATDASAAPATAGAAPQPPDANPPDAALAAPSYDLGPEERSLIRRIKVMTWRESQAHFIGPIQKEKVLVTILFGIISLVAVALILCILYMIVLQKTRDIGIVKSLGGSSLGVATIFIYYGAAVGVVGSILGTILGWLFVTNINEIQDFLIRLNPDWRVWDLQVYSFDRIPSELKWTDAAVVVAIGILASSIGSLAAAWRAGTMHPVESLRYE